MMERLKTLLCSRNAEINVAFFAPNPSAGFTIFQSTTPSSGLLVQYGPMMVPFVAFANAWKR